MPRLKTKKGVAKRFKVTKKKKVTYAACGRGHLMSNKNRKRLRSIKKERSLDLASSTKYIKRLLPYDA